MKSDECSRIEALLHNVPDGEIATAHHSTARDLVLRTEQFLPQGAGKGQIEAYSVFPGVDAAYHVFAASKVSFRHAPASGVLELFHCHSGRVGWNMRGGMAIYLGAGDMTIHSAACCADSAMMFPLGYAEGISISIDPQRLAASLPESLRYAGFRPEELFTAFCQEKSVAIPACPPLEGVFAPLYSARPALRKPYLQLKIQELLLYLMELKPEQLTTSHYSSQQAEWVKDIHRQLTEHLDQRFTIEALAKQYLINPSTLKDVFKAVYGLPIATYMKEYRMRQAMKLLRDTDASIANIAAQVGMKPKENSHRPLRISRICCPQNTANSISSARPGRRPIARYGLFHFIAKGCSNKLSAQRLNCTKKEQNALQNAFCSLLLFFTPARE